MKLCSLQAANAEGWEVPTPTAHYTGVGTEPRPSPHWEDVRAWNENISVVCIDERRD